MVLLNDLFSRLTCVLIERQGKIPEGTLIYIREFNRNTITGTVAGFTEGYSKTPLSSAQRLELAKLKGSKIAVQSSKLAIYPDVNSFSPIEKYVTLTKSKVEGSVTLNAKEGALFASPKLLELLDLKEDSKVRFLHTGGNIYISRCENKLEKSHSFTLSKGGGLQFSKESSKEILESLNQFFYPASDAFIVQKTMYPVKVDKFSYTVAYKLATPRNNGKKVSKKVYEGIQREMEEIHRRRLFAQEGQPNQGTGIPVQNQEAMIDEETTV